MDLYIAKREILENFPKIILGKSLRLLVCVAPVNIALTVAHITFQRPFTGRGVDCMLSLPQSYSVSWTACCLPVGLEKMPLSRFWKCPCWISINVDWYTCNTWKKLIFINLSSLRDHSWTIPWLQSVWKKITEIKFRLKLFLNLLGLFSISFVFYTLN